MHLTPLHSHRSTCENPYEMKNPSVRSKFRLLKVRLLNVIALLMAIVPARVHSARYQSEAPSQKARSVASSPDSCIVMMTGDVNLSSSITSADIIYVVNTIFILGPQPQPCLGTGDVNCSGSVSAADVIVLVNYVFKSGPPLCEICTSPNNRLGCDP